MSVKVTKIAPIKNWIDDYVIKIEETINGEVKVFIDPSLLPQKLQDVFEKPPDPLYAPRLKELISIMGRKRAFARMSYGIWSYRIPQEIKDYLEKLIDRLSLLSQKSENSPIRMS
jgi:hypothetical protein